MLRAYRRGTYTPQSKQATQDTEQKSASDSSYEARAVISIFFCPSIFKFCF